jgi:DNA repair photolyase
MAEREGLNLSITTKSDRVVRDIDLLQRISARSSLTINLSVTTLRTRLARLLEPRAPRPDLRLAAVHRLREAGLAAGVFAMPILPGITDGEEDLDALASAAKVAGALWFAGNTLFLMPSALKQFLPFVETKFPRLADRYRDWFFRHGNAPESYRSEMAACVRRLRQKYNLGARPESSRDITWRSPQLNLELGNAMWPCEQFPVSTTTCSRACAT